MDVDLEPDVLMADLLRIEELLLTCASGPTRPPDHPAPPVARYGRRVEAEELRAAIADRADWQISGTTAVYAPAGEWSAHVRAIAEPERASRVWHVAILERGTARHTHQSGTAAKAVGWAERLVASCLAPPPSAR